MKTCVVQNFELYCGRNSLGFLEAASIHKTACIVTTTLQSEPNVVSNQYKKLSASLQQFLNPRVVILTTRRCILLQKNAWVGTTLLPEFKLLGIRASWEPNHDQMIFPVVREAQIPAPLSKSKHGEIDMDTGAENWSG